MNIPSRYRAGLWLPDEKPMFGARLIKDHPLAEGLVLDQLFNEGGGNKTFDGSGKQNHGVMSDCAWGRRGIDFNGSSSYINCGNDPSLNITDAITIEAWVKLDSFPGGDNLIVSKGDNTDGYYLEVKNNGAVILRTDGVTDTYTQSNDGEIELNKWYHIVCTFGGGQRTLYKNGDNIKSEGVTGTINSGASIHTTIGIWSDYSYGPFNGTICLVRIYEIAKTPKEIWQLYTEPYCMYEYPILEEGMLYYPTIMNQFQRANLGADLYDGVLIT